MPTKKYSIKTRLILLIFLTSFSVLLLENVAFIVYQRMQIKETVIDDTGVLLRVLAHHSEHAILDKNKQEMLDILNLAQIDKSIVTSGIYDTQGTLIARYDSGQERVFEFPPFEQLPSTAQLNDDYLLLSEPILHEGTLIGTLFLRASLEEMNLRWRNFLLYRTLMIFIVSSVTLIIVFYLQRLVSRPIERINSMIHAIVVNKNYRIRVPIERDDEIGALAHTFNIILEVVEKRDEELHRCNERLVGFEQKIDYPSNLLALSSLHIADGIEHIGGNIEAYLKQLRRFREHFANAIQDLKNIVFNEKDMLSAGVYLNALKGVSGNIGAISLFRYISNLANNLRENRPLEESDLKRLEMLLEEVFRDIDSLPFEKVTVSNVKKCPFSPAALLTKTEELQATLENDLGESEKHLMQLCELASGSEFETLTEAIAVQLDEFNIEQASLLLDDLKQRLTLARS